MTLTKKMIILLIVFSIGLLAFGSYTLQTLRSTLIENKKQEIETILSFAVNQASFYIQQQKKGNISHTDAQKEVIRLLSNMRNGNSFIWANDNTGIARVHPDERVLGTFQQSYPKYIGNLKDNSYYFKLVGSKKQDHGERLFLKVNGMTKLPGWNWMLGIGFYLDDIDSLVNSIIFISALVGLLIISLVLLFTWLIEKWFIVSTIGGDLQELAVILEKINSGDFSSKIRETQKNTLFSTLSSVQNNFKRTFISIKNHNNEMISSLSKICDHLIQIKNLASSSTEKEKKHLSETIEITQTELKKAVDLTLKNKI